MSVSPQKHPASEAPAGPVPPAGGAHVAESLVLLTRDESLIEALAHVVPRDGLILVADEAALTQHLMSEYPGVAFIDAAIVQPTPGMAGQLIQRLHRQLPDIVLVVAGDSATQNELAALVTDGTIYRFVHKPVSAQRVKLFVESAWRKRDGTSGASGLYPALTLPPPPLAPLPRPRVPWPAIAAVVVAIAAALAWWVLRTPAHTGPDSAAPASAPVAAQRPTPAVVAPETNAVPATAPVATASTKAADLDRLATGAEQALLAGNLSEATRLTDAARAVDPDHVRVKFLSAQIAREQARIIARRLAAERTERPAPQPAPPSAAGPTATAPPAPLANTSVPTPTAATVSSSPAMVSAPERKSVPAITLQRVHSVDPEFPELARTRDIKGYVDVEFTVLSDGSVANVTVVKSQPAGVFDKSAVDAVRQWRYRPLVRDGVPIEEHARLRLNFDYK